MRRFAVFSLLFASVAGEAGQQADEAEVREDLPARKAGNETAAADGLWPTPKLMELLLSRWSERLSDEFDLTGEQRAAMREIIVDRWSAYLNEHRPTLQPLVNDMLEMRLSLEPPSEEQVQSWAERAGPVLAQVAGQIEGTKTEMRGILKPAQRAKFEMQAVKLSAAMKLAQVRLEQWQAGRYELHEVWDPPGAAGPRAPGKDQRAREGAKVDRASRDDVETPQDQILQELAAWDRFVAEFAETYGFDEAQRDAALSALEELKGRALDHRDRQRERIEAMERRILAFNGDAGEMAAIKADLIDLYGPIDEMFKELKHRVEQIPTAQQRARVKQRTEDEAKAAPVGEKPKKKE